MTARPNGGGRAFVFTQPGKHEALALVPGIAAPSCLGYGISLDEATRRAERRHRDTGQPARVVVWADGERTVVREFGAWPEGS